MIENILFALLLLIGIGLFVVNLRKLIRNIKLGKSIGEIGNKKERMKRVMRLCLGQTKIGRKAVVGILHGIVYAGFFIINVELLEIVIDGLFGTHRYFSGFGGGYNFLIGAFEILALMVIISVCVFWIRRNVIKIKRLNKRELDGFAKRDANTILIIEMCMMSFFLIMNAAEVVLQSRGVYHKGGSFPVSSFISGGMSGMGIGTLVFVERLFWWMHIIGVMIFLNYLYYSKHLHVLFAFAYGYLAEIKPKGKLDNLRSVMEQVKIMTDPNIDPFSVEQTGEVEKFGASDVMDLTQLQLLSAYTCTECGRCSDACPANMTGKKLSPRRIMMATRDRIEEVGRNIDKNGSFVADGKQLLRDYILEEELWACTTCNACVEACPIEINPVSIIMDMRRYLVMEESAGPAALNMMMNNVENSGSVWGMGQSERVFDND